jgi:hypothetical protein
MKLLIIGLLILLATVWGSSYINSLGIDWIQRPMFFTTTLFSFIGTISTIAGLIEESIKLDNYFFRGVE